MTIDWKKRIDDMFSAAEENERCLVRFARRGAPLQDEELAAVEARLGYTLDPRFVAFFRAYNGVRLLWLEDALAKPEYDDPGLEYSVLCSEGLGAFCGSINVPSLAEMFPEDPGYGFGRGNTSPGDTRARTLGGWDDCELRITLRTIDNFGEIEGDSYPTEPALVAHPRYPDPVVILTTDHAACLDDHRPMLARDYLELIVATMGSIEARFACLRGYGYGGDHPMYAPAPDWLAKMPSADRYLREAFDELTTEEYKAATADGTLASTQIRNLSNAG